MSTSQWIAIVAGVLILLIIIGVVVRAGRKRKVAADQAKAEELRRDAERARLDARGHAANAATADARAQQNLNGRLTQPGPASSMSRKDAEDGIGTVRRGCIAFRPI